MSGAISAVDKAEERTFYLQYKLKNSAANSKNSVISAVGEAIGAAQESLTGTYEYLANNVTNDFIPSMLQGNIDMNVYPGDEQYVLITTKPFSQAGATTVYAYQSGTRTLTTSDGFEKEVRVLSRDGQYHAGHNPAGLRNVFGSRYVDRGGKPAHAGIVKQVKRKRENHETKDLRFACKLLLLSRLQAQAPRPTPPPWKRGRDHADVQRSGFVQGPHARAVRPCVQRARVR